MMHECRPGEAFTRTTLMQHDDEGQNTWCLGKSGLIENGLFRADVDRNGRKNVIHIDVLRPHITNFISNCFIHLA